MQNLISTNLARMLRKSASVLALVTVLLPISAPALADRAHSQRVFQAADVIEFFGADPVPPLAFTGAAWLKRSKNAVQGRVMTKVANAGRPHTVWWVIFNNPGACEKGCNGPDLGNPAVRGAVFYANGAISSSDGNGGGVINVDISTVAARIPDGLFRLDDVLPEPVFYPKGLGRGNGLKAEIHLIVDDHLFPGGSWVPDLTTTDFPGIPILGATNHRAAVFAPVH